MDIAEIRKMIGRGVAEHLETHYGMMYSGLESYVISEEEAEENYRHDIGVMMVALDILVQFQPVPENHYEDHVRAEAVRDLREFIVFDCGLTWAYAEDMIKDEAPWSWH